MYIASHAMMQIAPSYASAAEDITFFMTWATFKMAPLFAKIGMFDDKKNVLLPGFLFYLVEIVYITVLNQYYFTC